jgi:hypothetical protein
MDKITKTLESLGDAMEKELGAQTFVHSSKKENRKSISEHGLGASDNPVITSGIYTFPEEDAREMFDPKEYDYYHIKLKPGSKILITDSDRPMDYVLGNFASPFKKEWERIVKETGLNGQEDILKLLGTRDEWFEWKAKFHRGVERYLQDNGYAGIQEGGQFTITDLSKIESIKLNDESDALVKVNTEKKFRK